MTIKKIFIVNGPNLNFLGIRELEKYGSTTYSELIQTMLIGQAISSFNLWTGQEIKFDHVYHEILERLNNED